MNLFKMHKSSAFFRSSKKAKQGRVSFGRLPNYKLRFKRTYLINMPESSFSLSNTRHSLRTSFSKLVIQIIFLVYVTKNRITKDASIK